jgi:hypothetical protein
MALLHSSAPLPSDLTEDDLANLSAEIEEALRTEGPEVIFELSKDVIVNLFSDLGVAVGWLVRDQIYVRETVGRQVGSIIEVAVLGRDTPRRVTVLVRKAVLFENEGYMELRIPEGVAADLLEEGG